MKDECDKQAEKQKLWNTFIIPSKNS
jgi:hypothetical protein